MNETGVSQLSPEKIAGINKMNKLHVIVGDNGNIHQFKFLKDEWY